MRRRHLLVPLLAAALALAAVAPVAAKPRTPGTPFPVLRYGPSDGDNVVLRWNDTMLATIRLSRTATPPVNARALAVLGTAMYDAWAAYDATARATQPLPSGLVADPVTQEAKAQAISHAAYRVLTSLPPYLNARNGDGTVPAALTLAELNLAPDAQTNPALIGRGAADAVLAARLSDGSNEANGYASTVQYTPRGSYANEATALLWQPLPTASGAPQSAVLPHWRNVTGFGLPASWRTDLRYAPRGPATNSGNGYKQQARDIVGYVANLTDAQKACALYWADGPGSETPPGHWNLIAQAVSRRDGNTLDEDVKMFFALGNALLNAGVVSWEAKYRWDFARPVTYIRWMYYYGAKKPDPAFANWNSYIATPPFPEYTSGHSTFSGAAAQVLRQATGSDAMGIEALVPAGTGRQFLSGPEQSPPMMNVTLRWETFSEAVSGEEGSGISRLYGGIHFRDANEHGQTTGTNAGQAAWDEAQRYVNGTRGH